MSIEDVLNRVAEGAWSGSKPPTSVSSTRHSAPTNVAPKQAGSDLGFSPVQESNTPPAIIAAPKDLIPNGAIRLPVGVRLLLRTSVAPSSGQPPWLKITDLEKFISAQLADLDSRLNSPVQIRGGGSVFEILKTLADVGLELAIERPAIGTSDGTLAITSESSKETPE